MVSLLDIDGVGAPVVALIDASAGRLDEAALRARARNLGEAVGGGAVSRSYCHPYALVGWHTGPIGVDIERIVSCDEQFARSICTPTEIARMPWASDREIVSLWSGKEALAKALGDGLDYDPRRLESPRGGRAVCAARGGRPRYRQSTVTARGCAGARRPQRPGRRGAEMSGSSRPTSAIPRSESEPGALADTAFRRHLASVLRSARWGAADETEVRATVARIRARDPDPWVSEWVWSAGETRRSAQARRPP